MGERRYGEIKKLALAAMPDAYAEASDDESYPAPARDVFYAVRRISGLGDALRSDYFLKKLLNPYCDEHPEMDIVRDARGTFSEPHTGTEIPLGTIAVRDYLDACDVDDDDQLPPQERPPRFSLTVPTDGPLNRFGSLLYIEKEGKLDAITAAAIPERFDLAIASCKGYSVVAARKLVRAFADSYGVEVLVAHDFDKAGFGIADTLGDGFIDLGLRLDDVTEEMSESVTYDHDPRPNLELRGATPDEIDFLVRSGPTWNPVKERMEYHGRRVELNALVGRAFTDWLEARLVEYDVAKVVPSAETIARAYDLAWRMARINEAIAEAFDDIAEAEIEAPADLVTQVTYELDEDPAQSWDAVVADIARRQA